MSCKYCENMKSMMSDFEYGYGIESVRNRSVFARVARDPETNLFYFEVDEDNSSCFNISILNLFCRIF